MHIHPYASAAVDAFTFTGGRFVGTAAALISLAGAITAGLALARRHRTRQAGAALAAGLLGLVVGTLVVVTADGGPGTGNGIVGGIAAVAIGLITTALASLAMVRARRVSGLPGRRR